MLVRTALVMSAIGIAPVAAIAPTKLAREKAPPAPRVVTVTAVNYAFEAPASIPAGVTTFHLVNKGTELHHIWLVRLEQGKTLDDFMKALGTQGPPPEWVVSVGGPNTPVPGGESEATVDLAPGNYVLTCVIPSNIDGQPHIMKGMVKSLTVTKAVGATAEPTADLSLKLVDYGFDLSAAITPGRHVIRVDNAAQQEHELVLVRLSPERTAQDVAAWVANGQKGPPPGAPIGGLTGIRGGAHAFVTADFQPGTYALLCFVPGPDGKDHAAHGMVRQIRVGDAN